VLLACGARMRIEDISPREETMIRSLGRDLQSVSGKGLCVALSADGTRAYLGGHSGVWRSDDGGETWWHPEWLPANPGGSTLPGALIVPNVYDLLIDPANNNIVLAATGRDARKPAQNGIYRSTDGAATWTRVHQFLRGSGSSLQFGMVGRLARAARALRTCLCGGRVRCGAKHGRRRHLDGKRSGA
jgi:hypothetical protein